jgi:hypothetical protein
VEVRLIKDLPRWRDLLPWPYLELAEEEDVLRLGVEWVPQGTAALGIEFCFPVSRERARRVEPLLDRVHATGVFR